MIADGGRPCQREAGPADPPRGRARRTRSLPQRNQPPICSLGPQPLLDTRTLFRQRRAMDRKNGILYSYPGGEYDMIFTSGIFSTGPRPEDARPAARIAGKKAEGTDMERSMRRARAKLRRLALANDFEYFVTLTLDPAKIDRYDGKAIVKALGRWADNMVRRHGLRYILVPERHKDGAFHFHGFMAGRGLKAEDSGVRWDGRAVFNLTQWTLGYSTAQKLYGDYHAAVGYCCKYIGKEEDQRPLGRWYFSGGALAEPEKELIEVDYEALISDAVKMGPLREGEFFPRPPVMTKIGAIWVKNDLKHKEDEQNEQQTG